MARTYKIRSFKNGQNKKGEDFINYSLTLPTPLAEKLVEDFGADLAFEIKLTKEGILYIPTQVEEGVPEELPFKAQKAKAAPKKPAASKPSTNGKKAPAKPAAKKAAPAAKKAPAKKAAPAKKTPAKPAAKAAPKRPAAAKRPTAAKPGKTRPTAAKKPQATGRKRPARAAA